MKELLATRFASAIKVRVVCNNLNSHTMGAFYEAFDPVEARALCRRIEFIRTQLLTAVIHTILDQDSREQSK